MDKIPDVGWNEMERVMAAANAALRHEITLDEWESVIDGKVTLESVIKRNQPAPVVF
jgi:hypothetical protein